MGKYEIVHKDLKLTEYESDMALQSEKNNRYVFKMPQFLLELLLRATLKYARKKSLEYKLPEVKIKNSIVRTEMTFDIGAGQRSVYFYYRDGLSGKYPLLYFIHGGGFIGGTYLAQDSLMRKLCDNFDVVCASVEYHVSPEAKFPTAVWECEKGLSTVLENAETGKYVNSEKVYVSGDSAGGNLAAVLCILLKNVRNFFPAGQILLYPVTNMHTYDTDSYKRKALEYACMRKGMLISRKLYARSKADYRDIYFSPLLTTEKDDPKPTDALLLLAGRDGLLDDGVLYGKHLYELGGNARTVVYDNAFHAFANGLGDSEAAEDMFGEIARFIGVTR